MSMTLLVTIASRLYVPRTTILKHRLLDSPALGLVQDWEYSSVSPLDLSTYLHEHNADRSWFHNSNV